MADPLFSHMHRVSYAECTLGNHVYYARYLDLLEVARGEFLRHVGLSFRELHEQGSIFPVIEARLRYKAAAQYDDVLRIEVRVSEIARVRLTFRYRILHENGTVVVEAETIHACTDPDQKLKRIPEALEQKLAALVPQ